jgi:hypothetical protein
MSKLKCILIFAAILALADGVSANAAQANSFKNYMNNLDRRVCQKFPATCKSRSTTTTKRKKQVQPTVTPEKIETSAAVPMTKPPIPIEKPKTAQITPEPAPLPIEAPKATEDVMDPAPLTFGGPKATGDAAEPAPRPRAKPQELRKHASVVPAALPDAGKSITAEKLINPTTSSTQRPVIAAKTMVSAPQPRSKPEALQQQAALIPRALPKEAPPQDDGESCLQMLRAMGAKYTVAAATVDYGKCNVENPVNLQSITTKGNRIDLPEAPLLNCKFALQFSKWLSESGAPILSAQLDSPVERISTGPGFECRGRNGDGSAKISEHGYGNAVDISTFQLRNGKTLSVGETTLLPGVRASACGYFTTVLGPGSNAAHATHFHFDMGIHGKSGNYRICQ